MSNRSPTLDGLPYDVLTIIARMLMPYDIVALSSVCKALRPLLNDKVVWLDVADTISYSRPLPFTARQALSLSTEEIYRACMRMQRLSIKWSKDDIYARGPPKKIEFDDKRIISYFTFLPGSFHLLLQDMTNKLSCWSVEGLCLAMWQGARGAQLSRWKPFEECDGDISAGLGRDKQAVEIIVEYPSTGEGVDTRFEVLHLVYCGNTATFTLVEKFSVPFVYDPFSSMTQDDLRGTLVSISDASNVADVNADRVGIFLTDTQGKKAICIDTGLVPSYVPQGLLSSHHLVLYWETANGAHVFAYDIPLLRSTLTSSGHHPSDLAVNKPVFLAPNANFIAPFKDVMSTSFSRKNGAGDPSNSSSNTPDLSPNYMQANLDWFPVIIPKWTTLREDLYRHRTRSVMTFSRRPSGMDDGSLFYFMNFLDLVQNPQQVLNTLEVGIGTAAWQPPGPPLADLLPPSANRPRDFRSTISHHYFDYSTTPTVLKRTVIAEANLRKPQNLYQLPNHGTEDIEDLIPDQLGGSPVMGSGGRCALWVEENEYNGPTRRSDSGTSGLSTGNSEHRGNGFPGGLNTEDEFDLVDDDGVYLGNPVAKLATFPSPNNGKDVGRDLFEEIDVPEGKVSTLHLPKSVNLRHAIHFDLDDVCGLVGIGTIHGELFLVDCT